MKFTHLCRTLVLGLLLSLSGFAAAEIVNINKADAGALVENLPGIGEVKAKAIVEYRKKNGKFKKIEDLLNVPGIGKSTFNNLKSEVSTTRGATKATGKKPITSTKQLGKQDKAVAKAKDKAASKTKDASKAKDKLSAKAKEANKAKDNSQAKAKKAITSTKESAKAKAAKKAKDSKTAVTDKKDKAAAEKAKAKAKAEAKAKAKKKKPVKKKKDEKKDNKK